MGSGPALNRAPHFFDLIAFEIHDDRDELDWLPRAGSGSGRGNTEKPSQCESIQCPSIADYQTRVRVPGKNVWHRIRPQTVEQGSVLLNT